MLQTHGLCKLLYTVLLDVKRTNTKTEFKVAGTFRVPLDSYPCLQKMEKLKYYHELPPLPAHYHLECA